MKRLFIIFALTIVTMSASAQLLYKISFCADHRNDERISTVIVQNFG